jgi:serine/threonine-protein phosphatase 5
MSAGSEPTNLKSEGSAPAILSEEGKKRYFICHGGPPVSKDGVTLEEVAKIDRYVFTSLVLIGLMVDMVVNLDTRD